MDAGMAVYVIFRANSLKSGHRTGVQSLLKGKASMFTTNGSQLGISNRTFFKKVLIDLKTMKVLAEDPAWGKAVPLSEMIKRCEELKKDDPPQ